MIGNIVEKDWNNPDETDTDDELSGSVRNLSHTQYQLQDMELITTIGVGAFGRVEVRFQLSITLLLSFSSSGQLAMKHGALL